MEIVHKPAVREERTAQQQQPCRVRALALAKLEKYLRLKKREASPSPCTSNMFPGEAELPTDRPDDVAPQRVSAARTETSS